MTEDDFQPEGEEQQYIMGAHDVETLVGYRARMDGACEVLFDTMNELGIKDAYSDDQMVELAANKLKVLFEMVQAAGINESMLKAVMRG